MHVCVFVCELTVGTKKALTFSSFFPCSQCRTRPSSSQFYLLPFKTRNAEKSLFICWLPSGKIYLTLHYQYNNIRLAWNFHFSFPERPNNFWWSDPYLVVENTSVDKMTRHKRCCPKCKPTVTPPIGLWTTVLKPQVCYYGEITILGRQRRTGGWRTASWAALSFESSWEKKWRPVWLQTHSFYSSN